MSVLLYIDQAEGHVKSITGSAEVLKLPQLGTAAEAVVLGTVTEDLAALGKYGVSKSPCSQRHPEPFRCTQVFTGVIGQVAQATAEVIIFPTT